MKRLLLVLALAVSTVVGFAASTPADFTQAYVSVLKKKAPKLRITVVADLELKVVDETNEERTVFLNNAYDQYKLDPVNGHEVIQRYTAAAAQTMTAVEAIDRSQIVAIIKDRAWLDDMRRAVKPKAGQKKPHSEPAHEDYNGHLVVLYAEDTPTNVRYLNLDDLSKLGLTLAELRPLALNNLRTLLKDKVAIRGGNGVYLVTADGSYEASLILTEKIWQSDAFKVQGDIVVAVPARDMLLVTGSKDAAGLAKVREVAEATVKEAPYRLTAQLFILREGKFQAFTP